MYAFPASTTSNSTSLEPCSAVSASALILYTAICCLVSETILLYFSHQSFCSAFTVSDGFIPSSKPPAGLLFILTAMFMSERRAPAAILLLSTICSGFRMRFVFPSLQRTVNMHPSGTLRTPRFITLAALFAKCF